MSHEVVPVISVAICTVAPLALLDLVYDGCEMVKSAQIIG